jgi:hypothetical protein
MKILLRISVQPKEELTRELKIVWPGDAGTPKTCTWSAQAGNSESQGESNGHWNKVLWQTCISQKFQIRNPGKLMLTEHEKEE